jgi:hypothetical protein
VGKIIMNSSNVVRLVALWLGLLAVAGCSDATAETPQAAETLSATDEAVLATFAEGAAATRDRADFSQETVLKLNPIVARSKIALDRFDDLRPQLVAAQEAGDKVQIASLTAEIGKLKAESDAARAAFEAEKKALLARKEYYNEVVFGAMEQFVAEAPDEIAEALTQPSQ